LRSSRPSPRSASASLKAGATRLEHHESRLIDIGGIKVVQFGPGVELVPVAVASVEEFSAATGQGSALLKLEAVITGPQFEILQGSRGLIGQAVVNGRIIGNSAPDRYFMATIKGPDGIDRLTFGKGDPPPKTVATGFGGAVPLIINGQSVPGYEKAWIRYAKSLGTGKNIVAYDSKRNITALFIQPHAASGYSLQSVRSFINAAGYNYAVLFDGSGSTSLRYKGKAIVSPTIDRELLIPLAIGFRMRRR
jgi:Phosphodiester glycosidase